MKKRALWFIFACSLFLVNGSARLHAAENEYQNSYIDDLENEEFPALCSSLEEEAQLQDTADMLHLEMYSDEELESYYVTENLPEARNQGGYGTCWAFAANTLGELSILKNEGVSLDLSELQLAYFTYQTVSDPLGGIAGDINRLTVQARDFLNQGGNMMLAAQSLTNWKGAAAESLVPYENAEAVLAQGLDESYAFDDIAHIRNLYMINLRTDREAAKVLIKRYGAVATSYYNTFAGYCDEHNSFYSGRNASTNHAITIVGWDDNFPKENFNTEAPEDGAWLVRNSWGQDDESYFGYFWMSYAETSMSSNGYAMEFVSEASEAFYDNNYQYDGCIYYLKSISQAGSVTVANVFTSAQQIETLEAVSFETYATNETYEIAIYKNLSDANNPESGELVGTVSGGTAFAGFYTAELEVPVELQLGDTYSVVVCLKREEGNAGIMVEAEYPTGTSASWLNCVPSAEAGQSFVKEGETWQDYGAQNNRNIRIKAYTNTVGTPIYEIAFAERELSLELGDVMQLQIYTESPEEIVWESSDSSVVQVENGRVSAVGYGQAVVTASIYGNSAQCKIIVNPPSDTAAEEPEEEETEEEEPEEEDDATSIRPPVVQETEEEEESGENVSGTVTVEDMTESEMELDESKGTPEQDEKNGVDTGDEDSIFLWSSIWIMGAVFFIGGIRKK